MALLPLVPTPVIRTPVVLSIRTPRWAAVVPPRVLPVAPELISTPSAHPRIVPPLMTFPLEVTLRQVRPRFCPLMTVPGPPPSIVSFPVDRGGRSEVRRVRPPPGMRDTMGSAEAAPIVSVVLQGG